MDKTQLAKTLLVALQNLEQVSSNENFYDDSTGETFNINNVRQQAYEAIKEESKPNFTLTAFYDIGLSSLWFDDFKEDLGDDLLLLSDNDFIVIGKLEEKQFTLEELKNKTYLELEGLWEILYEQVCIDLSDEDIISDLLEFSRKHYMESVSGFEWFKDLPYTFSITGYSQGEFKKVFVYPHEDFKFITREYLTNIFYNVPIYAKIECEKTGIEIYLDEYLNDVYDWDKDVLLENFNSRYDDVHKEEIYQFLVDNLPTNLKYI